MIDTPEFVEVVLRIRRETFKAYLVEHEFGEAWIPKSQIAGHGADEHGEINSLMIAYWIATQKGMV